MGVLNLAKLQPKTLALLWGITPQSVQGWIKRDCPRNRNGTFDLRRVIAWREDQAAARGLKAGLRKAAEEQEADGLRRLRKAKADTEEMKRDERKGLLVSVAEVAGQAHLAGQAVRDSLLGLPARLPEKLAGQSVREIGATLEAEIKRTLNELQGELDKLTEENKAHE